MKRWKHELFAFSPKKTLTLRRYCLIAQSNCSVTSKRSIDWFLESSGHEVFSPEFSLNQPKATRVCIRSINQSNRSISVRLLFLFCSLVNVVSCQNFQPVKNSSGTMWTWHWLVKHTSGHVLFIVWYIFSVLLCKTVTTNVQREATTVIVTIKLHERIHTMDMEIF